ncbi:MAG TPA: Wzz/FepE/Etk N-terminal domain-containing protein [Candidatus Saccharimonadales bacterium]|nr:Wzz/FepE/Etk N-terminal domain-containing protein [Candidatus Saccharimonadales bacterium]
MEASGRHIDPRIYLRILWKRKALWLLPPAVILCTVAIGINVVPPVYEARTKIYYEDRPNLTRQLQELTGMAGQGYSRTEELTTQRMMDITAKIRSRPFLEQVVRLLRLNEDPGAQSEGRRIHDRHPEIAQDEAVMQILVENLRMRLAVEPGGANVFSIVARDNYPRNAQLLSKWVSQQFVDGVVRGQMSQIRAAGNFSEEQLSIYERKLRASEDALRSFQETMLGRQLASNPVSEKSRDQARSLVRAAESELSDLDLRMGNFDPAIRALLRQDPALLRSGRLKTLGEDLDRAEIDLGLLLLDKLPSDLSVSAQKDRVGRARQDAYDALTAAVAARHGNLSEDDQRAARDAFYAQMQVNSIRARRDKLQKSLDDYERNYRQAPREQLELDRLRQDVATNRALLEAFRNQSTGSRISEAVESTSLGMRVEVLEQADRPLEPVSPNGPRVFAMALLLGPLLGFGVVFLTEYLDTSFRTIEEVESELGLPVLGTMPRPVAEKGLLPVRRRWIPITVTAMVAVTAAFFVLKLTLFPDLGRFHHTARAQEPPSSTQTASP